MNHKGKRERGADISEELKKDITHHSSAESEVISRISEIRIMDSIGSLQEPYGEVFSLRMFSGLSFAEIGTVYGKSDGWARVVFHRAKLMLKEDLKDEYQV